MNSFSKIKLQQRIGYKEVFIYYSKHGAKFRESTRVKIFDYGVVDIQGTLNDLSNRESIRQMHKMVEDLIIGYVRKYEDKPPVRWLRIEYDKAKLRNLIFPQQCSMPPGGQPEINVELLGQHSIESNLFFHWDDFTAMKRQTTRTEGTIKRYENLLSTISKFKEKYTDKGYCVIGIHSFSQIFFNDLVFYMIKEHEYFRAKADTVTDAVSLPEIGLGNETIIKRLTDLIEYLSYCKRRKGVAVDLDEIREFIKVAKFKHGVIKQCDSKKWELTLTPEELQFVVNLDHFEPKYYRSLSAMQKRYLDIFIFMCLQGTSPVDTKKIKETDIVRGKLVGDRSKTRSGFKVELDPIAEQILRDNNYNMIFLDQPFNEAVKKLFITIFELYRPYFEDKYDEEYQIIYTQRKSKGDEEFFLIQHKGMFAEGMTGRRTFITNLNEEASEVTMRENMRRTGHARIQTHLGYQKDRQTGKNSKRRSLFGVSKIVQNDCDKSISMTCNRRKRRQRIILDRMVSKEEQHLEPQSKIIEVINDDDHRLTQKHI